MKESNHYTIWVHTRAYVCEIHMQYTLCSPAVNIYIVILIQKLTNDLTRNEKEKKKKKEMNVI